MDRGNTLVQMGPGAHTGPIWAQVASSSCPDLALQPQPGRWDLEIIEEGAPKPEGPGWRPRLDPVYLGLKCGTDGKYNKQIMVKIIAIEALVNMR